MHVQMSLMSPFMLALWHMPCVFTRWVPRWRDADPSVSRETAGVHSMCKVTSGDLSERFPPLCDAWLVPPVGLAHVERSCTARAVYQAISEIFAAKGESPKFDLREI